MSAAELARWQTVTQYVQAHVKPQQFETWFSRLVCLRITTDHVLIQTPNTFYRNWMEEHYRTLIERATAEITDADPRVTFTIADEPEAAHASASSNHSHPAPAHSPAQAPLAHTKSAAAPISPTLSAGSHTPGQPLARAVGKTLERLGVATSRNEGAKVFPEAGRQEVDGTPPRTMGDLRLNPQYTFEHFVVGPSNRLGHAACLAVTEKPALVYNPLFLHGDVGLGKTHLLQAVCFALLEKSPGLRVAYLSCEAFVNDYISKLQKGQLEIFRERYRHVDLLLIDDIHFLSSKKALQEEFFHTFNTLHTAQRQIILSSDAPPQEIPDLENRLVSRFKWGLVAEIEPPHYETKMAIIKDKAKARGKTLPDDVTHYLASTLDSNIRELEGAVLKVIVLAGLQNRPIDVGLCRTALKELTPRSGQVHITEIMQHVANHFHLKTTDLQSKKRSKSIVYPRQICMYLGRELTELSLEELGGHFGGRDHTTVLYSEGRIRDLIEKDPNVRVTIDRLKRELQRRS